MLENDTEALEQVYGSIYKAPTAVYNHHNNRKAYEKLIKHLVTYFQNPQNRSEFNTIEITEKKNDGSIRISTVDAKTLYIISVQIYFNFTDRSGKPMKGFFIYTNGRNQEDDFVNCFTEFTHATEPAGRTFWSPWFLFFMHRRLHSSIKDMVKDMVIRLYRSLIVTISEAIRFNKVKNYVANRFHQDRIHNWTCLEYLINDWEHLSRRNDRQVTIICM